MKNLLSVLSFIFCFALFTVSCSKTKELNSNSTYSFDGLQDSYDSKSGIYTRKYWSKTIEVKIDLSNEEKTEILQSFFENNFTKFPKEIDCSSSGSHPIIYERLCLNNKKVEYRSTFDEKWLCFNGQKFDKIYLVLTSIIRNKPEVKKLPDSNIFYE